MVLFVKIQTMGQNLGFSLLEFASSWIHDRLSFHPSAHHSQTTMPQKIPNVVKHFSTSFPGSFPQAREKTLGTRLSIFLIFAKYFGEIHEISLAICRVKHFHENLWGWEAQKVRMRASVYWIPLTILWKKWLLVCEALPKILAVCTVFSIQSFKLIFTWIHSASFIYKSKTMLSKWSLNKAVRTCLEAFCQI